MYAAPRGPLDAQSTNQVSRRDVDFGAIQLRTPIRRELKPGELHSYTLALMKGQYAAVVVQQKGIDVLVSIFAPSGEDRKSVV